MKVSSYTCFVISCFFVFAIGIFGAFIPLGMAFPLLIMGILLLSFFAGKVMAED